MCGKRALPATACVCWGRQRYGHRMGGRGGRTSGCNTARASPFIHASPYMAFAVTTPKGSIGSDARHWQALARPPALPTYTWRAMPACSASRLALPPPHLSPCLGTDICTRGLWHFPPPPLNSVHNLRLLFYYLAASQLRRQNWMNAERRREAGRKEEAW